MKKLALLASGTGSNAQKIIDYFRHHDHIEVSLIVSNKPKAGVLQIAQKEDIPFIVLSRESFYKTHHLVRQLQTRQIDFIILAGFLWLVPDYLIKAFTNQIINIHPALLPNYGGKGMYGMHVHEAVKKNGESESGITIHYVNENYDEGQIIKQVTCSISSNDAPLDIRNKVLVLEHYHYPRVIESLITDSV